MKKVICFFLIIPFLFSCLNKEIRDGAYQKEKLKIDLDVKNIGKLSTYFDEIEYILLESPEHRPMVQPYKIVIDEGNILLQDIFQNYLFVFSESGKFLNVVDAVGEGPGEITFFEDFQIIQGNIWIKERMKKKFFVYDLNGKYLESQESSFRFGNFYKSNDYSLYYLNNDPDFSSRFARVDFSGITSYFLDLDQRIADKLSSSIHGFIPSKTKEETYFIIPFTYEIGVFDYEGKLYKLFQLDFGKYHFTLENREKLGNFDEEFDFQEINEIGEIHTFFPFGNGFLMQVGKFNQHSHTIFLDQEFQVISQYNQMENDLDGFPIQNIAWSYDKEHVFFIYNLMPFS